MQDQGLVANATLSPADQAVEYVLNRIQVDPDLRYQLGWPTESFRLLVAAEAERLQRPHEEIEAERMVRKDRGTPPRLPAMEEALRSLLEALDAEVETCLCSPRDRTNGHNWSCFARKLLPEIEKARRALR